MRRCGLQLQHVVLSIAVTVAATYRDAALADTGPSAGMR
jgi:hypothetical protein